MPAKPSQDADLIRLLQRGHALRQAGDLKQAAAALEHAARRAPRNGHLQHDLGLARLELGEVAAALRHFERAVELEPGLGIAHFRRGVALEMLSRPGATQAYRRAIQTAPELAEAYACLASAEEQAGRRLEALALYRLALARSAPGGTPALMFAARIALIEEDTDCAETALRAALAQSPALGSARGLLAGVLNTRGRFDEAAQQLEQALRDRPRDVALYYNLVQSRHLSAEDAPALIARMRQAQALPAPATARLRLHLALARALDRTGAYAEASAELQAADRLRAQHMTMDRAALRTATDRSIALFTRAFLARHDHARDPSERPILVLGLPRSGTTLVERILASHPAVASGGELSFWDTESPAIQAALLPGRGADLAGTGAAYLARLTTVSQHHARVVDKNPFNYRSAALAHLVFPNARIIHCRRHPADTALSTLMTALRPQPLFGTALDDLLFCHREHARAMAHVRAVLPPNRLYELQYDNLVADPEPEIRALLAFCGLEFNAACLAPQHAPGIVRSASLWQARQPIHGESRGRWRQYTGLVGKFEKEGVLF